jgi:hypothetical protein
VHPFGVMVHVAVPSAAARMSATVAPPRVNGGH